MNKWLIIGCTYLALIAVHGYRFGDEDMSETLSYALYLNDHALYPADIYIQAVGTNNLNERYPFTRLLAIFGDQLEWASFLLHLFSSLLLISGLVTLVQYYLKEAFWQIVFLLTSLVVLYNMNLGGNEIWYHYFVPSHLAKAIGIWGLWFWLRDRSLTAYGLAALATFAQPVVGAQLALIFVLIDGIYFITNKKTFFSWIKGPLLYALTAGIWIVSIFTSHLILDDAISDQQFYKIMETRLAHHFFPSYYPLKSWLVLMPLFVLASFLWQKIDTRILSFYLLSFVGMGCYILGVEVFEITALLSVQWFKVTVWLKPLSILAVCFLASYIFSKIPHWVTSGLVVGVLLFAVLQISGLVTFLPGKPYHFPLTYYHTPDMQLALILNEKLPNDACIIIPPTVTGIRYFSERSIYVDYKSNIHSKTYMAEAASRRLSLYNMNLTDRRAGKDIVAEGLKFYQTLDEEDFKSYKIKGATHVMTDKSQQLNLTIMAQNLFYTVYQL